MIRRLHRYLGPVLLAVSVVLSGGCTLPWHASADPAAVADREAALRVRTALTEQLGVAAAAIAVSVTDGVVTLDGFTASAGERDRAVAAARAVGDVHQVRDRIEVRR